MNYKKLSIIVGLSTSILFITVSKVALTESKGQATRDGWIYKEGLETSSFNKKNTYIWKNKNIVLFNNYFASVGACYKRVESPTFKLENKPTYYHIGIFVKQGDVDGEVAIKSFSIDSIDLEILDKKAEEIVSYDKLSKKVIFDLGKNTISYDMKYVKRISKRDQSVNCE